MRAPVGVLTVLVLAAPASAKPPVPPPLPQRVAWADCVILGTVEKIEDKTVKAPLGPRDEEEVEFQIAVIKIDAALVGAKGLTHIRVGFIPPNRTGFGRGPSEPLTKGQEACFFLSPHGVVNFHIIPDRFDLLEKDNANFEEEVAEVKRCAKLFDDPAAGLASKKADERYLTAAMLLTRYRVERPNSPRSMKTVPVDIKESGRLLEILAEGDWSNKNPFGLLAPRYLFGSLGLTENDGWKQPQDFKQYPDAAKKWLKENAGKYKIQRFAAVEIGRRGGKPED
jgi:hypothetical protein